MKSHKAELVVDARAELGEGPCWNSQIGGLTWVDFLGKQLHLFKDGQDKVILKDRAVSACMPCEDGRLLIACPDGLHFFDRISKKIEFIVDPEANNERRLNDGKIDPAGRFWVGSVSPEDAQASLFCLEGKTLHQKLSGVALSNGLDWSLDGRTFYYVDTPTREVRAYSFSDKGELGEARVIRRITEEEGWPDGLCIDSGGRLWLALYQGGQVICLNPQDGRTVEEVIVPGVSRVTCPGFGGPELDILYISTAWEHAPSDERQREPHAGGLFAARVGVGGRAVPEFKQNP